LDDDLKKCFSIKSTQIKRRGIPSFDLTDSKKQPILCSTVSNNINLHVVLIFIENEFIDHSGID
jgi:hypothetical protein